MVRTKLVPMAGACKDMLLRDQNLSIAQYANKRIASTHRAPASGPSHEPHESKTTTKLMFPRDDLQPQPREASANAPHKRGSDALNLIIGDRNLYAAAAKGTVSRSTAPHILK